MKKLIFLIVLGTALFATPCHAQARMKQDIYADTTSSDITVVDCTTQKAYRADYGIQGCPTGYAMWDLNLKGYASCITVKAFNYNMSHYNVSHWAYMEMEDGQDLSDIVITCSNNSDVASKEL
jgi:hypothetical protein